MTPEIGGIQIERNSFTPTDKLEVNLSEPLRWASLQFHRLFLKFRLYLPQQHCFVFSDTSDALQTGIGPIYVINLDRETNRWSGIVRELNCIADANGNPLSKNAIRYSARDAQTQVQKFPEADFVDSFYTLSDQLFVEPQPNAAPDTFDLELPIQMSNAEIAVACSHIGVWKEIAKSSASYALVLEDDVWFERKFSQTLNRAWDEMRKADRENPKFDILYLSYKEVRHGAPKELISPNVFRPERGLWCLSGYALSKKGAQTLVDLLPCRGPIDLWINHKFRELNVRALHRSIIHQRRDLVSSNSYSILPALTRIGILDSGNSSLFHRRPIHFPVFAFGTPKSGLSSLATALAMFGYRCCSDLEDIPVSEFENLLAGRTDRMFDAYVNIGSLASQIRTLSKRHPNAKYIVTGECTSSADCKISKIVTELESAEISYLRHKQIDSWRPLCEYLKLAPPDAQYPIVREIGQRKRQKISTAKEITTKTKWLRHDPSPWIMNPRKGMFGINATACEGQEPKNHVQMCFEDNFSKIDSERWFLRNDTFPGNLGLFRPANITSAHIGGLSLAVIDEPLGVRDFSAAAISSRKTFLFGRFEAVLQSTNIPGLVTGFFLHRDSPRQEIDFEILGNRPDQILVNVFYNPGSEGAKFDYGYRGTPARIKLGFDASKALHKYAIEWNPCEIRWLVDEKLIHRRAIWGPTSIPDLPMTLHVNTWPTRSRELAGRLATRALPASAILSRIAVTAFTIGESSFR